MPYLAGITIYPVKSLEPVALQQVRVLASGALEGDRSFAIFDSENKFVNGKRNALVHRLRSAFDPMRQILRVARADAAHSAEFHVERQRDELNAWLSEYFGIPVTFRHNGEVGFPDDLDCPGPTLISTGTLAEVASWLPPLDAGQVRVRIRANLEFGGVPAFWEEKLYTTKGSWVKFKVGDVIFHGNNPCQRCVVPPRDPLTGENYPGFSKIFSERRPATLPDWAEKSRFNHFYRLAINTIVPASESGKMLRVGDDVEILGIIGPG